MSTPSPTGMNEMNESYDYKALMFEIKSTIDKNDNLFKLIQKANYPNAGSYSSDLLNYKIDTQVTDLKKAREQIWDFLTKKYEENTKLRTYYFAEIRKVDNHIKDLELQKQEYIDFIETTNIKTSTSIKAIKNEKYNFNKMEYYLFLYKLLVFVQLAILAIITLCITGIIPRATCLILTVIILISTVAFVSYYVFFVNIGRNKFSWNKFEHKSDVPVKAGQCINDISPGDKAKEETDSKIDEIIKANRENEKCTN
jgi:hypothetical protein